MFETKKVKFETIKIKSGDAIVIALVFKDIDVEVNTVTIRRRNSGEEEVTSFTVSKEEE